MHLVRHPLLFTDSSYDRIWALYKAGSSKIDEVIDPLPSKAQAVIIGGGVIGSSVAYHLAEKGMKDIIVLEQGQISGGMSFSARLCEHLSCLPVCLVIMHGWRLRWP